MFSRPSESLRLQLLRWLLPPLLLLLTLNAWLSNRAAVATADMAFDRLLTASAEAIAEDVAYRDGEFVVDLPYAALELLESNIQERIFYRVVSPAGQTVTGYDDLPLPKPALAPGADYAPARMPARFSPPATASSDAPAGKPSGGKPSSKRESSRPGPLKGITKSAVPTNSAR